MAKIVIAGKADCPYYARAELLGDKLSVNLPDFKLHKIVKRPEEWPNWLHSQCQDKGWTHTKSPLVWRELIDRGGKGVLIGGANEFQEYAQGYYGVQSEMKSVDMQKVAAENLQYKVDKDEEDAEFKAQSKPLHVCITNASSPICYCMLDRMASGDVFGSKTELIIHLYDSAEKMESLEGLRMEVCDLAHGLLRGVELESDMSKAFSGCGAIILLDELRKEFEVMSHNDWLRENANLFISYAKVIDSVAKKDVRVLVAGAGPVNFNAFMLIKHTPSIPRHNIAAMSRMLENQSKAVLAERLKVNSAGVVDLIVWGSPYGLNYIDVEKSRVHGYDGSIIGPPSFSVAGPEMVFDQKWLETEYLELVRNRQNVSETKMEHPTMMSWAAAVNTTMCHWWNGSPSGQMFSLGVYSEGWYGIPKDLVYSLPVTFLPKGGWNLVQDIDIAEKIQTTLQNAAEELLTEIDVMFPRPTPPTQVTTDQAVATETKKPETTDSEDTDGDGEPRLETIIEDKAGETNADKTGTDESSAPESDAKGEGKAPAAPETEAPAAPETEAPPAEPAAQALKEPETETKDQLPTE